MNIYNYNIIESHNLNSVLEVYKENYKHKFKEIISDKVIKKEVPNFSFDNGCTFNANDVNLKNLFLLSIDHTTNHFGATNPSTALTTIKDLLNKLSFPPTKMINIVTYAIDIAKKIENCIRENGEKSEDLDDKIQEDLKQLNIDESIGIPICTVMHMMFQVWTFIKENNGIRYYEVAHSNGGVGVNYHDCKIVNKEKLYETTVTFIASGEVIHKKGFTYIKDIIANRLFKNSENQSNHEQIRYSISNYYTTILPKIIWKKIKNDKFNKPQFYGNCPIYSTEMWIKDQLNESEYIEFKTIGRYEAILRSFTKIKTGACFAPKYIKCRRVTLFVMTLECIKVLANNFVKKTLPKELIKIKNILKLTLKMHYNNLLSQLDNSNLINIDKYDFNKCVDNLEMASLILEIGEFSKQAIKKAEPYLKQMGKINLITEEEENFQKIVNEVVASVSTSYNNNNFRTMDQVKFFKKLFENLNEKKEGSVNFSIYSKVNLEFDRFKEYF